MNENYRKFLLALVVIGAVADIALQVCKICRTIAGE